MARMARPKGKGRNFTKSSEGRSRGRGSSRDSPRDRRADDRHRGNFRDEPRDRRSNERPRGSFRDQPRDRRRSNGPRGSFAERRDSGDFGRNREFTRTRVICASCGIECEVPFKPTSSKPVLCRDCFSKKDKVSSNNLPNKDLEIINEKLDKIMHILGID